MAKLTDKTELTSASTDDLLYVVDSPGSSPVSKKITFDNLQKSITATGTLTDGNVDAAVSRIVQILVSDPNGDAITTGDGKAYFRINSILNGYNLVAVAAHVTTVSSSGNPSIAIYNVTQTADMLSTNITIDANEKDSKDATTPAVIDTNNDDVATGDEIRIDVDTAGTGTKGLIVELTFQLP